MADVITNMKVRIGADTKQFKKGMDDGKRATQQFKRDAGSALDQFAAAFGVNMYAVRKNISTTQNALTGLGAGFKTSAAGSNILSKALKVLKVALISTGIGTIVVALGSLVSYFTKTQRGADSLSRVFKSVGAIVNVFVDRLSGLGEKLVTIFENPREAIKNLWDAIKTNIVNRFEGLLNLFNTVGKGLKALWERDWDTLKETAQQATTDIIQITSGLDAAQQKKFAEGIKGVASEIRDEAKAAAELEKRSQALRDKEISLIEIQAKRRKELEAARLLAEDETIAADERLKALQRAQELEKKTLEENQALQREKIAIMEAEIALGESTAEDYRQLAEEKGKLYEIESQSLRLQKRLQTEMNSLTNEINSQTEAIIKLREEKTKDFKPIESQQADFTVNLDTNLETDKLLGGVKNVTDEASSILTEFQVSFESMMEDLAISFGEGLGNLLSGAGSFQDFGNILLSSVGDLAIMLGKLAIQTGITMAALKLSFANPATAIAAGIALVAIGTAVKNAVSSAMSGSSGGSSGTFSGNQVYDTRSQTVYSSGESIGRSSRQEPIAVVVSGQLQGRGGELIAVINETQKRSSYRASGAINR